MRPARYHYTSQRVVSLINRHWDIVDRRPPSRIVNITGDKESRRYRGRTNHHFTCPETDDFDLGIRINLPVQRERRFDQRLSGNIEGTTIRQPRCTDRIECFVSGRAHKLEHQPRAGPRSQVFKDHACAYVLALDFCAVAAVCSVYLTHLPPTS